MVQQLIDLPETVDAPVRVYAHRGTGATVTCFGMLHVAQESFFAEVLERVGRLHAGGAHVLVEGITSPASDAEGATTAELRWGVGVVKRRLEAMWREGELLGLAAQRDELPVQAGWRVCDVTVLEAVKVYGAEALRRQHREAQQESVVLRGFDPALTRAVLIQSLAMAVAAAGDGTIRDAVLPEREGVLARIREGRVLSALDEQLAVQPDAHVVIVWGAAHLSGFDRGLRERGFTLKDEQHLPAIDAAALPPLGAKRAA